MTTTDTLHLETPTATAVSPVVDPGSVLHSTEAPQRPARPLDDPGRCHFRYPNGKRCTLPGLPATSGLCLRHYNRQITAGLPLAPSPSDTEDLSADLLPEFSEFDTAEPINRYVARLLVLATKGRVTPRRAAVLGYLTNQLLHTVRAMDQEEENQSEQILFDLPRPRRD